MRIKPLPIYFRLFDYLMVPLMWFLNSFKFPLQETHHWHGQNIDGKKFKGIKVSAQKTKSIFGHNAKFGLYHMPIFGGLDKYVVLEAKDYKKYWYVGWKGISAQVHRLPIKENKIKLLTPKHGSFEALAFDEDGKNIKLKIIGYGTIGDKKFSGVRLF